MKAFRVIFVLILTTSIIHSQPHWTQLNSNTNLLLLDLCFISENVGWVVGHGGIILKTTNGGTSWIQQNSGTTDNLRSVCFIDDLNGWVGSDNGAILNTTDGGTTWYAAQIATNNDAVRSIKFIDDSTGYAVISEYAPDRHGYIFKTSNAGQTWYLNYYSGSDAFIDVFAYQEFGWVVGTGMEVYSIDYGNSWNYIFTPGGYWLLDVYFTDPETGWAVGGSDYNTTELIIKSSDGGYSWQVQKLDYNFKSLQGIYFINPDTGWAVGDIGRILYSTDGGTTWTLQNSSVGSTLRKIQFASDNIGYTVGDGGVILKYSENPVPVELISYTATVESQDVLLSWRTATETNNKGFEIGRSQKSKVRGQKEWEKIRFVEGHGTTTSENSYTYTDKNLEPGIYSYKLIQVDFDGTRNESEVISVDINNQPEEYILKQNYPNPFNPATTLNYQLPQTGFVTLKVYDILGNEIKRLVNEEKPAGRYELTWNAEDLPSGVYFYQLRSGDFMQTKKMILLK